jgi:hypothetical protein
MLIVHNLRKIKLKSLKHKLYFKTNISSHVTNPIAKYAPGHVPHRVVWCFRQQYKKLDLPQYLDYYGSFIDPSSNSLSRSVLSCGHISMDFPAFKSVFKVF